MDFEFDNQGTDEEAFYKDMLVFKIFLMFMPAISFCRTQGIFGDVEAHTSNTGDSVYDKHGLSLLS